MIPIQKDLSLYRGDTTAYKFDVEDIDPNNFTTISIRFRAIRADNNKAVIDFPILQTDTGNNWSAGQVQVNISSGMTQAIDTDKNIILKYDLEVSRTISPNPVKVKTEYYGTIVLIPDVTVGNPVITPLTEANLKAELASNNITFGASMVGVATSIWGSLATTVQQALQYLKNNILAVPSSWVQNRILKTSNTANTLVYSGLEVDSAVNVTGANSVTVTAQPTINSHLTRKDYVDQEVSTLNTNLTTQINNLNTNKVSKSGDTMTGNLTIPAGTLPGHAINKQQLDNAIVSIGIDNSPDWDSPSTTNAPSINATVKYQKFNLTLANNASEEVKDFFTNFSSAKSGEYIVMRNTNPRTFIRFYYQHGTPANADVYETGVSSTIGDVNNNLCIFQSGNDVLIKNRLGSSLDFTVYRRQV